MRLRWIKALSVLAFLSTFAALPAGAQESRDVVTTQDSDYFGFDLRSERDVTLDQCETVCLAESACRAFTYNVKAKWCFMKSDFSQMKPFKGAVAGKVVTLAGDPDIGAPPALGFFPTYMVDEARSYRDRLLASTAVDPTQGLAGLVAAAETATKASDPRTAMNKLISAIALSPDDGNLWTKLAIAMMATQPVNGQETSSLNRDAASAIWNAYQLQRTAKTRAEALAVMARTLDRRELFRPALMAYEASLAMQPDASLQAEYQDLKARKGFRVVEHKVEADTSSPRICAQFSEDLVKVGVDYTPFVTVDGQQAKAIEAKERQICVEGLEHGKHYQVAFRTGLPAQIGEVLEAPVSLSIYMQDRPPSVRFTGDSFVLPSGGRRGIPVVTVNMNVADIKLYRVGDRSLARLLSGYNFLRQLDGYEISNIEDDMGEPVWEGKLDIAPELNKEVTTSFPVDQAIPERKPGVYVLTAQPEKSNAEYYDAKATQWFVVSDIGLTTYTGQDGLNVFARSLGSAKPVANAELTLLARNNEILGTAKTDAEGRATFNPGLTRGNGSMVPAVLMANAEGGNDFVFLDMTKAGFDLSDRGVEGRTSPGALDVFAWTERGIYRVGETVHVGALARDDAAKAVEKLPMTFIFSRPDGVEERRIVADGASAGGYAVQLPVANNAMRGAWSVSLYTDPEKSPVATKTFLVEDFVPDRIEINLKAEKAEIARDESTNVDVDGKFLYGAPAAGLALEGEIKLTTKPTWERFKNFAFGLADEEQGDGTTIPLENLPVIGEDGTAKVPVAIDALPSTTRLINAGVTVRMREGAGRAVERSVDMAIKPATDMIGVKAEFEDGAVSEGSAATFSVIGVDNSGNRKALNGLQWTLVKIERDYQWYRNGNSWNYEPITYTRNIANGKLDVAADKDGTITVPTEWGRYRLEVETSDPDGPKTSYEFESGWYVEATSTETPDGLEIALDQDKYVAGSVAKLKVSPRFAGELQVIVGSERVLKTFSTTVPAEGATVDIPVEASWGGGAYITATLFRPGNGPESRMPARSIGLTWLTVDPKAQTLNVAFATPEKTEPNKPLSIPVTVTGAGELSDAYVSIAAVDVGILNLTRYQAPDPESWYFGQRMLGLEIRDLYGRIIDGSLGADGKIRTGGDGGLSAQGNPPKEKLVAFFEGPVKLDADGKATVNFDIPQFNGTVRVMAVAWTKEAIGHGQKDVIVRDPMVITAGYPRFMAPGDSAIMRLEIANTDAPDGDYTLAIDTTGELSTGSAQLPAKVALTNNGKRSVVTVPLLPQKAGDTTVTIKLAKDGGGPAVSQVLNIPVRPAQLPVTTRLVVDLGPNGKALRIDKELLAASLLENATVSVGVSPSAAFDVPSLIMTLDRYPYGCAEQTTSRALPLLYVSELAAGAGMKDEPELKKRIQDAIYRVLNYQSSSGSFGLWGPGSGDLWLDSYVSDFLTRARELNYDVPQQAMAMAVNNLQNSIGYDVDIESRGTEIAYAIYVLARNKKASIGDLRYYTDTKLEAFSSPMAVAQLAASLSLYGDSQRANETFQAAFTLAKSKPEFDWYRSDYGSKLRDGAAILAMAAESNPTPPIVPELIKYVSGERNKVRWTSTQDEAWMLLAARALRQGGDKIQLDLGGTQHKGNFTATLTGAQVAERPLVITNTGSEAVQAVVTTVASPKLPLPAGGDGFAIERTYYKLDGAEANVTEVNQNDRFVVVLNVTENNAWPSRVLVSDLLPAGFELDNPGLVNSANLSNFDWLPETSYAHLEFRDDRFIAAFDRNSGDARSFSFAYVVRAVTPGVFAHPAATVEDMYRPQFAARTATGMMEIKAQ